MHLRTSRGYDLAAVVSAMQKAIRRNDLRVAGYFAMELHTSGFGAYAWRRIMICSAEDCAGLVTQEIKALFDCWDHLRTSVTDKDRFKLAGRVFMAKAIILLCTAAKSRDADHLANLVHEAGAIPARAVAALLDVADVGGLPDYTDDVHTAKGKRAGKTRRDFFLTEDPALAPRGRTLFDADLERLRAGALVVTDRHWRKK